MPWLLGQVDCILFVLDRFGVGGSRCSFSRWFRISRFRRMKMRRKKVISGAMLSSTLRKFLKKYVSSRPLFLVSYKLLFPIRPSYVLIVFAPPQIVSTAILGLIGVGRQTWKIFARESRDGPRDGPRSETLIAHNSWSTLWIFPNSTATDSVWRALSNGTIGDAVACIEKKFDFSDFGHVPMLRN